jgi:two-component system, chemotaxis family, CheB/CheR fusion protein
MPIRDKEGNIELWLGTNTDIHKQKQTEASLKVTEERFKLISKATNDAIWDWDLLTNKLWWNQTAFTIFGYKNDEISDDISWWDEHIHPDDRQRVIKGIHQVIDEGGNSWSDEYRFIRADGSYAEILDRGYIIHDEFKKPVRMVGSMLDISERKRSEEALLFEREKLQAIIENMGVGVGITDPVGTTLSLNKSALKIHGFQEESEMLAQIERYREIFELQYPDGKEMPFEQWPSMRAIRGERVNNYEVKLINSVEQTNKYISYTAVPLYDGNEMLQNFIFTLTDLTDRKETEEKLNFQKSLLEAQQEVSPLGNLVVSPDGKMLTYNRRMIEMWHLSDEIMGSKIDDKALQNAKEQLKDPDAFIAKVIECYKKRIHNHEKLYFKDGRIFDRYGAPVNDENGNYYGYVWYFLDITEQENLARQKDDFLGIASHELKTPVAIMKGYINMVERLLGNKDLTMEAGLLKKADIQIIRLTNLINDLLDVTKIESGKMQFERKEFEFDVAVEDVVESMQHITSHRLVQNGKTGIKIIGDKERTGQVIANFISNAVKYSPKSTEIIIDTWSGGAEVFFQIKDHGIGISKEDLPKVFDRFFRVRGSGNHSTGLGLGLYISSEIIKRQNGRIWAESTEGVGSVFGFSLPIN